MGKDMDVNMTLINNNNNLYTSHMHTNDDKSIEKVEKTCTGFTVASNDEDKTSEVVFVGGETSADETDDLGTTNSDTNESDEDGWYSSPPDDYMEHIEVTAKVKKLG